MQDVIIVGVPLFAILAGILFSRSDVKDLRVEMNVRFNGMNTRFNEVDDRLSRMDDPLSRINADLRQFYHLTGKLEARMDSLDKHG